MDTKVERGGLSSQEASVLLALHGPNRLVPERRRSSLLASAISALTDPMVLLLLVAGPTYLVLGDVADAVVTFVALVPIVSIDLLLEARAERALEGLKRLTAPTATVRRDGRTQSVNVEAIVPGDVVLLHEGDVVPADGAMVSGSNVMLDESTLTGESHPMAKDARGSAEQRAIFAGTTVLSGRGEVVVETTGQATRYGQIGTLVAGIRQKATPLQRTIGRMVRRLSVVALVFCAGVVGIELLRGNGWGGAIIAGVSLGIAAIPEEFPMVFTLYLALGAWRLARDRALVRRLAGVETLGSTTVICTDKTGTLTLGRQEVASISAGGATATGGEPLTDLERETLAVAILASEPRPFDPLEQAILRHAVSAGIDVEELHSGVLEHDYPFDPSLKYVTHVWRIDGGHRVAAKGAIEGILARSLASEDERLGVMEANRTLAAQGMRVIAVAGGDLEAPSGVRAQDELALRLLGLVAFTDPLRPGVAEALGECRAAGIRVIMITGDHPETARAVAKELGLPGDGQAISLGDDLDHASEEEIAERVGTTTVFARTRPEHKHLLIRALKSQGHVVAMTGDGINDAPALREADIGVAMGERGTEVAREAATMVLLDDNFATIVAAVRDGRRIFENLRRAFSYLIAFHVPLLLGALIIPLAGKPLLLLPVHLVLLELVLHPTISLVFENDPAPADLMRRPPRSPDEGLLSGTEWTRPFALGLTLTLGVLGLYLGWLATGAAVPQARAVAFAALLLGQTLLVFTERSPHTPVWRSGIRANRTLPAVALSILAVAVAAIYAPPVTRLLRLATFPPAAWAVVLAVAAATTLWMEPAKAGRNSRRPAGRRV